MAGSNPQLTVEISANIETLNNSLKTAGQVIDAFGLKALKGLNNLDKDMRQLGANAFKQLNTDLQVAQGYFQLFGDTIKKDVSNLRAYDKALNSLLTAGFRPTSKEVLQVTERIEQLNKKIANSTSPFAKTAAGANQAAFALSNLGRVAQDAPFGFIGIQNNLNPLLESFQALRKETGSNSAAFKALIGSLTGAGGIGLALSAVTAVLTFSQMGFRAWTGAVKDAKEEADDYVEKLEAVRRANLLGAQDAQQEVVTLKVLYEAYTDANRPLEERQEAYRQLQEKYPAYFKNLKFEKTATDAVNQSYKNLTNTLIESARAQASLNIITENENKRLVNQAKINDLLKEENKQRLISAKALIDLAKNTSAAGNVGGSGGAAGYARIAEGADKKRIQAQKDIRALLEQNNALTAENQRLVANINVSVIDGIETLDRAKDSTDKIAEIYKTLSSELKSNPLEFGATAIEIAEANIKSYQKAINDLVKEGYEPASKAIQDLIDKQNQIASGFVTSDLAPAVGGGVKASTGLNPVSSIINNSKLTKGLTEYQLLINAAAESNYKFIDSINSLANSTLESGLGDAFASIGTALAEGTNAIDAFGQSLLATFAAFLSQLGQMFIKEGIAQIGYGIAKNLILPGSGANNIAGGIGMIGAGAVLTAVGGAAKAKTNSKSSQDTPPQIRGFATGGYTGRGGINDIAGLVHKGEYVVPASGVNQTTGLPKSSTMNAISGGGSAVILEGDFGISLDVLYWKLKETGRKLER